MTPHTTIDPSPKPSGGGGPSECCAHTATMTTSTPDDGMLWDVVHPDRRIDDPLRDGLTITVGGDDMTILHTPGHSPGGCCIHVPSLGTVFSGDTLFNGGPGATGRSFSDLGILVDSIRSRLFVLDGATTVHTGHGDSTTIGDEARRLEAD